MKSCYYDVLDRLRDFVKPEISFPYGHFQGEQIFTQYRSCFPPGQGETEASYLVIQVSRNPTKLKVANLRKYRINSEILKFYIKIKTYV